MPSVQQDQPHDVSFSNKTSSFGKKLYAFSTDGPSDQELTTKLAKQQKVGLQCLLPLR